MEAGIFPRVEFWRFSQNRPPTRVSRTLQNRGPDLHRRGGIAEKASSQRKKLRRRMRSCTLFGFAPTGVLVYESGWRSNLGGTGLTGLGNRSDRSPPRVDICISPAPWKVSLQATHHFLFFLAPPSVLGLGRGLHGTSGLDYS